MREIKVGFAILLTIHVNQFLLITRQGCFCAKDCLDSEKMYPIAIFCVFSHFRHGDERTTEQPGDPSASLLLTSVRRQSFAKLLSLDSLEQQNVFLFPLLLVSPIFLKVLIHKIISIEKWLFNKSTLAWTRNAQGPKPITQGATQLQEGPLPKLASYLAATLVQHFARGEYF